MHESIMLINQPLGWNNNLYMRRIPLYAHMLAQKYKILAPFLDAPSREKYGREIDRGVDLSHERVVTYLRELAEEKVLSLEKKGRQVFYRLNKESETVRRIMAFLEYEREQKFLTNNKTIAALLHELKKDILSTRKSEIQFILLFGSVARGQARPGSDIDLLVVSSAEKEPEDMRERIKKRSKIAGRGVSMHFISLDDLEKFWHKEPVYKNIWRERIVLYGEDRFWEFILEKGEA